MAARGQIPSVAIDMHEPPSIEDYYYEPLHLFSTLLSANNTIQWGIVCNRIHEFASFIQQGTLAHLTPTIAYYSME